MNNNTKIPPQKQPTISEVDSKWAVGCETAEQECARLRAENEHTKEFLQKNTELLSVLEKIVARADKPGWGNGDLFRTIQDMNSIAVVALTKSKQETPLPGKVCLDKKNPSSVL